MIYLFDKDEQLIKLVKKDAIKTALQKFALTTEKYVSDRLTVEMKALSKQEFDAVEYMAIQSIEDAHTFHYFYIAQKFSGNLTTLIGVQSGIEELRKSVVLDKRPHNTFARPIINELLAGTNWQARFISETSQRSTNFYYISTFEALKKVCQVWNLEMQFFVEVNGNKIGARYIDFKQKIGEATGKRVVYGHNALQILQEVERTNLFTALIGRGKGEEISAPTDENNTGSYGRRITFDDVVWEVKKGNPVDKPKGQKYVELPEMTKRYGIKNADGTMRAKVGFAVFEDEEDKNALIKRTYDELVSASRPQLTLKTSTVYLKGVKIGDTIRVVRHDKKLDYDTRIFEITFNRLNNESSDIKLGDRIGESNEAKAQTIAEKVVDDFVSNEFSDFVQKLPDFLPSTDGFNNNWYGAEDPTVKYPGKVLINDIWFKPDPEHEGHKIMLRWTGEVWDEILRSYDKESLKKRISEEIANFDKSFQSVNERNKKKIDEILQSSGASSLLAQEAKRIGLDLIAKLEEFKRQATGSQTALSGDLDVLKRTVNNEVNQASEHRRTTTESLSRMTGQMNGFATKSEVAQGIDGLTQTFAKMKVGGRNYAEDYDFSRGLWIYSQGDGSPVDWKITNGEYNVKGTTNTWKHMQIYSKEGRRSSRKSSTALLDLEIGETYTLSFQGICYSGSPNVWVSLRANRTAPGNPEIMYGNFNLTSSWQTYQVTIPALTKPDNFDFWRMILGYNEIGHVAFRKVELTRSSTRIDAGPAPEDGKSDLIVAKSEFQKTADGLSTKLATIETYIGQDSQRQEALQRYTREESARQATAVREFVSRDFVGKVTYQEDVHGINQRIEEAKKNASNELTTRLANYRQTVDGKFTDISSQVTTYKHVTDEKFGDLSNQIVNNKNSTDGQIENVRNQLAKKVEVTDFQRVQETSKLYERILGSTDNVIANNVARMAMTNQLFQVEVGKYSAGGPNLIKNSDFNHGINEWASTQNLGRLVKHGFYHNSQKDLMRLSNSTQSENHLYSHRFELERNTDYVLNFRGFNNSRLVSYDVFILGRRAGESNGFTIIKQVVSSKKLSTSRCEDVSVTFNSGEMDNAFIRFDNNGSSSGTADLYITEIDLYKGYKPRPWQPAPEDVVTDANAKLDATQTKMTQLAGSWAVKNLTNSGDVLNSINLLANGTNRIDGRLTHITGQTLIDNAVIKDGMIANVSANKLTAGTIDARTVNLINLNANNVTSGTFRGLTFEGGIVRGNNGNTVINLNDNVTTYNGYAKIEFKSPGNSLEFNSGGRKAFLAPTIAQGTSYAAFAFGVNDRGDCDPNRDFVGLKIFNQPGVRRIDIIGDLTLTRYEEHGIKSTSLQKLFELINDNFKRLREFRVQNGEGSPGFWDVSI